MGEECYRCYSSPKISRAFTKNLDLDGKLQRQLNDIDKQRRRKLLALTNSSVRSAVTKDSKISAQLDKLKVPRFSKLVKEQSRDINGNSGLTNELFDTRSVVEPRLVNTEQDGDGASDAYNDEDEGQPLKDGFVISSPVLYRDNSLSVSWDLRPRSKGDMEGLFVDSKTINMKIKGRCKLKDGLSDSMFRPRSNSSPLVWPISNLPKLATSQTTNRESDLRNSSASPFSPKPSPRKLQRSWSERVDDLLPRGTSGGLGGFITNQKLQQRSCASNASEVDRVLHNSKGLEPASKVSRANAASHQSHQARNTSIEDSTEGKDQLNLEKHLLPEAINLLRRTSLRQGNHSIPIGELKRCRYLRFNRYIEKEIEEDFNRSFSSKMESQALLKLPELSNRPSSSPCLVAKAISHDTTSTERSLRPGSSPREADKLKVSTWLRQTERPGIQLPPTTSPPPLPDQTNELHNLGNDSVEIHVAPAQRLEEGEGDCCSNHGNVLCDQSGLQASTSCTNNSKKYLSNINIDEERDSWNKLKDYTTRGTIVGHTKIALEKDQNDKEIYTEQTNERE